MLLKCTLALDSFLFRTKKLFRHNALHIDSHWDTARLSIGVLNSYIISTRHEKIYQDRPHDRWSIRSRRTTECGREGHRYRSTPMGTQVKIVIKLDIITIIIMFILIFVILLIVFIAFLLLVPRLFSSSPQDGTR